MAGIRGALQVQDMTEKASTACSLQCLTCINLSRPDMVGSLTVPCKTAWQDMIRNRPETDLCVECTRYLTWACISKDQTEVLVCSADRVDIVTDLGIISERKRR